MKHIFETAIAKGGYDLATILQKIDAYHIEGKLSDAERESLYALARKAPEKHYDCSAEIERLWAAVRALEKTQDGADGGEADSLEEWPAYVQPTGAHDAYHYGAQVTYRGDKYRCVSKEACVWAPDVYPVAWELVEAEMLVSD